MYGINRIPLWQLMAPSVTCYKGFFMIDTSRERLLTLPQACREIHGRPSLRTLWRWVNQGVNGNRLESILIGSRRYTSSEAIVRFIEAGSTGATPTPPQDRTRSREFQRAQAELQEAGY
jgi:hypothetical protein